MKIKKSDVLDYLIMYWMIAHVFIINWLAYITQSARVMICLIVIRLFCGLKRTIHLPALYYGLLFCIIYPGLNYIYLGGDPTILVSNMMDIITATVMLIYMAFICKYKRQFIIAFLKKNKYLFNVYMIINLPILVLQLMGHTELSGRHPESLTNVFSADLVSGLFGYNGTGFLTMYFCFLMLYNFVLRKCKYIRRRQLLAIYNLLLLGSLAFIAANSDNKTLFILLPLFLIVYLIIFKMNSYKNILQKLQSLFRSAFSGILVFTIFIIGLQPALGTIGLIHDILNKLQTGWMSANTAHGSAERLGMIAYALNNSDIRWWGAGIAKHVWKESYTFGFVHFGICDFGSFICLGGILFIVLLSCFLLAVYQSIFQDKIAGYLFLILTIVVLLYTQLLTVMSLTCSWIFLVFTSVMGCEYNSIKG